MKYAKADFPQLIDQITQLDFTMREVRETYGLPPFWHYEPGFASLLHIILGQQVSVASAAAAFRKLRARIGEVTPEGVLNLTDGQLRECYFSRQKAEYAHHLAAAVLDGGLDLSGLDQRPDAEVRDQLTQVKGIGAWTANIYLLLALHRRDIFPAGDLAAVKTLRELALVAPKASREEVLAYAEGFRPYRSGLTLLLWHKYIVDRGILFGSG